MFVVKWATQEKFEHDIIKVEKHSKALLSRWSNEKHEAIHNYIIKNLHHHRMRSHGYGHDNQTEFDRKRIG